MIGFIFDILFTIFAELCVVVALFVLWVVAFPIGCVLVAPIALISSAFGSRPLMQGVRDFYSAMIDLWLSIAPHWRPWPRYD